MTTEQAEKILKLYEEGCKVELNLWDNYTLKVTKMYLKGKSIWVECYPNGKELLIKTAFKKVSVYRKIEIE